MGSGAFKGIFCEFYLKFLYLSRFTGVLKESGHGEGIDGEVE
jgi:hypothetical protein